MTTQMEAKVLGKLRSLELTQDLETSHLKRLASMASERSFSEGQIIYSEMMPGKAVYLVEVGQVNIELNIPGKGNIVVNTINDGQWFGWSSIFVAEKQGNKLARAIKPTQVLAFDAQKMQDAWHADHSFENAIIKCTTKVLVDRVRDARLQIVDILTTDKD